MVEELILGKTYGWIYKYYTLRRARKEKICEHCKRTIKRGEIYLQVSYGRAMLEMMHTFANCIDCFAKANPHIKRIIDKKGRIVWER
jgi:hypothetical protein